MRDTAVRIIAASAAAARSLHRSVCLRRHALHRRVRRRVVRCIAATAVTFTRCVAASTDEAATSFFFLTLQRRAYAGLNEYINQHGTYSQVRKIYRGLGEG